MTDVPYNPHVALGLRALAVAMTAKINACSRADVGELVSSVRVLAQPNDPIRGIVDRFAAGWCEDPVAAGQKLHDEIVEYGDEIMRRTARRVPEVLEQIETEPGAWWQKGPMA